MMRLVHPSEDVDSDDVSVATVEAATNWPAEVDIILSAMEAGKSFKFDRRDSDRLPYRTQADLKLFANDPLSLPTALYTRDVSPSGMGFITRERLPLGYSGIVNYEQEDGSKISLACTIYRCREAINGWFEGALSFSR